MAAVAKFLTLPVKSMSCASCVSHVEGALKTLLLKRHKPAIRLSQRPHFGHGQARPWLAPAAGD